VKAPAVPHPTLSPRPGSWLWTCRAGFEPFLFEELSWQGARPRLLGDALVESSRVKEPPAFARMGFEVTGAGPVDATRTLAAGLVKAARGQPLRLQSWTPDTDASNRHTALAESTAATLEGALSPSGPSPSHPGGGEGTVTAWEQRGWLGQLCVVSPDLAVAGLVRARDALSLAPGGRRRMRRDQAPSRAAMKLEEALDGLLLAPGRGDLCVDLGAAPGGWTQRLVARGARVIAVDPAKLAPELARHPKVTHVQESAFAYAPDEPVDWLCCDMAWRPLEVAQLLAKWARRALALHLVANVKLPMKDKNPILFRIRHLLAESGWKELRLRQLYHDRDEVTVTATRSGNAQS
jgi:23S rRNA (cytidine2498-2'-O)-methyltransferase